MRNSTLLVTATGLTMAAALSANAAFVSLASLESGGSLSVGGLTFDMFGLIPQNPPTVGALDPNAVFLEAMQLGTDSQGKAIYGFSMNGAFGSGLGGTMDYSLTYRVTAARGTVIHDMYGLFAPTLTLGGPGSASVQIGELVTDLNNVPLGQLNLGFSGIEDANGNDSYSDPSKTTAEVQFSHPYTGVFVRKDILLTAVGPFNAAGATVIDQGFSVPEPGAYAGMFALGLVGFAISRRYRA